MNIQTVFKILYSIFLLFIFHCGSDTMQAANRLSQQVQDEPRPSSELAAEKQQAQGELQVNQDEGGLLTKSWEGLQDKYITALDKAIPLTQQYEKAMGEGGDEGE